MRKLKLKLTGNDIIQIIAIVSVTKDKLVRDILLDTKEISVYRLNNSLKIHRRLTMMSLRISVGKYSVLSFDLCEQLTLRYCLLNSTRQASLQNIFMTIDKNIHPSMFERNAPSASTSQQ